MCRQWRCIGWWRAVGGDCVGLIARLDRRSRTPPAEMSGRYLYDVDPVDGEEAWALFEACRDGDLARVSALIEHDPALVHAQYWYTQPIHFAVYANRPAVVRALLDAGAEPGRTRFMDSGWKKLVRRAAAMGFREVRGILEDEAGRPLRI